MRRKIGWVGLGRILVGFGFSVCYGYGHGTALPFHLASQQRNLKTISQRWSAACDGLPDFSSADLQSRKEFALRLFGPGELELARF